MKNNTIHIYLVILLSILFSNQNQTQAATTLTICGTGDSQELLRTLSKDFEKNNPAINISVPDSIGSGGGIRAAANGTCEFGRVARKIKNNEQPYNLSYHLFALSPVVFVLHSTMEKPKNLDQNQIITIFNGSSDNWQQVGGDNQKIYLVNREEQDSSRTILEMKIPGFKDINTFPGRTYLSTQEALQAVVRHAQTIAYLPLAVARKSSLQIMSFNGVPPTATNVQKGLYTLTAPFGLVWKGELTGAQKTFVTYLSSQPAQEIMAAQGAFAAQNK